MLNFIGNVIWLVTSWWVALIYLFGAILLFPLFPFLIPVIRLVILPFGKELVTPAYLEKFNTKVEPSNNFSEAKGIVRTLANVVWPLLIGWILALSHLIAGLLNILGGVVFCWTLVGFAAGIVNARVHFRLIPASFAPFGRVVISADVAKRLNEINTEKEVKEITG